MLIAGKEKRSLRDRRDAALIALFALREQVADVTVGDIRATMLERFDARYHSDHSVRVAYQRARERLLGKSDNDGDVTNGC